MKIAIVITSLEVGGAEKQIIELIKNIKNKFQIKLFVIKKNYNTIYDNFVKDEKIDVIYINKKTKIPFDIFTSIKLAKLMYEYKPDVIHTNLKSSTLVLYYYLFYNRNFKWIHTVHTLARVDTKYFRKFIMKKLYQKKIVTPVAVGNAVRDSVVRCYKIDYSDVVVINNGIDINKFTHTKANKTNFIFVGRLEKVKNVFYLIKEFQKVLKEYPGILLYIVGDGKYYKKYKKYITKKKLEKNIILTGNVSDVKTYLNKAKVFILPSKYEGFPIALVEAMVSKLAILAHPVGGVKELIHDGVNGFSLNLKKKDLSNKVKYLLKNTSEIEIMGQNSYIFAKNLSISEMSQRYIKLYVEPKKRRVAVIIGTLEVGGAEVFVTNLLENINYNLFEMTLIVLGPRVKSSLEDRIKDLNIKVHFLNKEDGFSYKTIFKLNKVLKKFRPDVIHGNIAGTIYSLCYLFTHRVKLIHTTHTLANIEFGKFKRFLIKIGIKFRKIKLVAISKEIEKNTIEHYKVSNENIQLITNGINIKKFQLPRKYDFTLLTIGHIGRMEEVKNHETIINVFEILSKKYPHLRLVLVGDGSLMNKIKNKVKEKKLDKVVFLLGKKDHVERDLHKIDIFFMPSFYEGLSLSLLEALASGAVIVASRVGGIKDVIKEDINGYLIDDPKDINGFLRAFERLITDEEKLIKMSQRNMVDSKKYGVETMVKNYENLYGEK